MVGTALTQKLIKEKYDVIPLDIKHTYWDRQIDSKIILHDLRKPINNKTLKNKPDMIIHLAANARVHDLVVKPQLAHDNYLMTFNLLEYARKNNVKEFVFSSSREVYGESKPGERRRETSTHVTKIKSPYTASKFGSEALIHSYSECYGINPVIVRLSNVYGRYDVSERVIPLFIYYAIRNRNISIFGKEKKLDFTYIDDCVDGIIRVVKLFRKASGHTFNLSRGRGERLFDLAQMIVKSINSKSKISSTNKRVGEITSYTGDISLARKILGFNPKVLLNDGLIANIDWYIEAMKERRVYECQRRNLMKRGWA